MRYAAIRPQQARRSEAGMKQVAHEFGAFAGRVRSGVDARLAAWLETRVAEAAGRGADVEAVADALRQLAVRGGKRLRAVLVAAAYEACGGEGGAEAVTMAGVALELLQTYLLAHDDWMDGDDTRRGGPSVPAVLRARFGRGARADATSVLAGDLASSWAQSALLEVELPAARVLSAMREMARAQEEVVQGQTLDVLGAADNAREVEAMHGLKTASYTTRGPVVMGARLAGAREEVVGALAAFAVPLGVAFQLRDDVLGVFGDQRATGKPAGADLRAGKRTSLVVGAQDGAVARVLGRADATDDELRAAIASLESSGARARVEARIAALVDESRAALGRVRIDGDRRALLAAAAVALTERKR